MAGVASLCKLAQTISQDGRSTELIDKRLLWGKADTLFGVWSELLDASFGQLNIMASVLQSTAPTGLTT